MKKQKIFIVDIGTEYFKMGFASLDCSVLEKTPEGIFDESKKVVKKFEFAQIIANHLNKALGDVELTKGQSLFLIVAVKNDPLLLTEIFKSSNIIKGILFVHPRVMDAYATGRTSGIVLNLSSKYLDSAVITDSKIIDEYSEQIQNISNESILDRLKVVFDKMFNNTKQEMKPSLLANVVLCGGRVTSEMVFKMQEYLATKSQSQTPKIILDHTIFSTYTGMDILAMKPDGFISRREWEEFGNKTLDKFGIEWYK